MPDSRALTRMPVYDITNGRVVGRVHRLVIDPDARKVVGLLLATRLGREARCLPFRSIHAIGQHAVTVRGVEAIMRLSELPDIEELARTRRRIYHSPILTEDGSFVGDVDEFTVNGQTGRIETLLVSGGMIHDLFRGQVALPAHFVVTIGEDATIVRDQAIASLKQQQKDRTIHGRGKRRGGIDSNDETSELTPADDEADRDEKRIVPVQSLGQRLFGRIIRRKSEEDIDPPVVIIDARPADSEPLDSSVLSKLGHEPRLEQHRTQNGNDIVPPFPAGGGEGGDGQT